MTELNPGYTGDPCGTVMLDLGHGHGADKGACANGLKEADVVTGIGSSLACFLTEHNIRVLFTGRRSLTERWRDCNEAKPDCLVMLHVNAAAKKTPDGRAVPNPTPNGIETIHWHGSATGKTLAESLLTETVRATALAKRPHAPIAGTKYYKDAEGKTRQHTGWWQGLWLTDCPAAIIEVGFITNPKDADYLRDNQNRRAAAYGIAQGLINWLLGR